MSLRRTHSPAVAGAKAGFSTSAAYRFEKDPRLPTQKKSPLRTSPGGSIRRCLGERRPPVRPRPPLAYGRSPCSRSDCCRHPELGSGTRRTLERRICAWRAVNGPDSGGDLPPGASAGPYGLAPGLHRGCRSWRHHCRPVAGLPALSLPFAVLRLRTRPCRARRRKFCRPCGRVAECPVVAGRGSRAAPKRQPLGGVPQSRRRRQGGCDDALRGVRRPLRHDAVHLQ